MKTEKSCGIILFTHHKERIHYVIIQNLSGHYGFPKGHVEPGELEVQTAIRETVEEVGIHPSIIPGFRITEEYRLPRMPNTLKQVTYFLGEFHQQEIRFQKEELCGAWLLPYEEAMARLQFPRIKDIFHQANEFICKRNQ